MAIGTKEFKGGNPQGDVEVTPLKDSVASGQRLTTGKRATISARDYRLLKALGKVELAADEPKKPSKSKKKGDDVRDDG